jgi:hypothetical protein
MADELECVSIEEDGPLLLIGVNRPDAHNLWNLDVIQTVCRACRRLADADHLRVGVIFGHGRHFTAGLDLASVGPLVATGDINAVLPDDGFDPWNFFGEPCPKPIVVAVHGVCNTLRHRARAVDALHHRKGEEPRPNTAGVIFPSSAGTLRDPDNFGKQWREVRESLGLPDVSSHSFRKTVATLIDDSGLSGRGSGQTSSATRVRR